MVGPSTKQLLSEAKKDEEMWRNIRRAAANDVELLELLNAARIYWILKYDSHDYDKRKN